MVRGRDGVEYFGEGTLETRAILKFGLEHQVEQGLRPKNRLHSSLSSTSSTSRSNGFQQQEQRKFSG